MFGRDKKQCSCGNSPVVHSDAIPTMGGEIYINYCKECFDKEAQRIIEEQKERERKRKESEAEKAKNDYYLWLKREVEIKELEAKAKEFGILPKKG